ncbi:alpha-N-acetylglucosaminidase [Orussus abietinus]|uniref:alpha-N-acetylglucosaminidase n=1 Tax=Orussus abietinus TaxID=222816 RepID=UPI000625F903|nr:alpha-N-acetylglucosaminidase [Orussus abietinus]XP_012273679.1 alpha-N-acetylglucosaminidase [Orussus abietinus]XP_012273680.1 alpha-N-acetylglucosaminidase [Orussus abietinus]XP_012273681.1 alpha-N-acetylglucosaminidase [Orussus abietinus]XP_012273682.1 alpha-N-acetylglucosaminidase [Orussus abietinus]
MRAAMMKQLIIIFGCVIISLRTTNGDAFQDTLGHLKPRSSYKEQLNAATLVRNRLLGSYSSAFILDLIPNLGPEGKDTFQVVKKDIGIIKNTIYITGTSGVAITWGMNYYLKNYCNICLSWDNMPAGVKKLPVPLPDVNVTITSNDRFRFYQNVVTTAYSMMSYGKAEWIAHIDWMALNGINIALALNAQEAVWKYEVFRKLNLTDSEIDEHFGGPAFLPWSRMGNIRGWGGPLYEYFHYTSINIQKTILNQMRSIGIVSVLPAFNGFVPRAFSRIFPNAKLVKLGKWNNFDDQYCCPYLLDPTDPLFQIIGHSFLQAYNKTFGTEHAYIVDIYNENDPQVSDPESLTNISRAVFSMLTSFDSQAVWFTQGWMFVHNMTYWTEPRVKAYVTAVPKGRMVVFDLQSEQFPQYERLNSYYGQPFIWCMLHNFGGTLGMFGSANVINNRVFEARTMKNSTMVGTGLTPEGINQNYVIYDLMMEMSYRKEPVNLDEWFTKYSIIRYGSRNESAVKAWVQLGKTIYNFSGLERIRGHYAITIRPTWKFVPWAWYDRESFLRTWDTFLEARTDLGKNFLYNHDVVDFTRQALQVRADGIYLDLVEAVSNNNITAFRNNSRLWLELLQDLEEILASGPNFLLVKYNVPRGSNLLEKFYYNFNFLNLISLWGPKGEIRDYGCKQWSGVVKDYFIPRWLVFLNATETALRNNVKLNTTAVYEDIFKRVEWPFNRAYRQDSPFPEGNSIEIALRLNKKWRQNIPMTRETWPTSSEFYL